MIFNTDALGLYSLDIKYEGTTKATQPCIDAFLKILYGSQAITGMTILTCGEHHAIMLEYTNKENITFIKSGLTSGYNGEGPRGTSTIIKLAEEARITIKELAISRRLMKKVNESLVTAKDVHSIQESSKENFDYKRLSLKFKMEKKVFKSGESLPPEVINELMNLSFDKEEDEVGYLPLPGDYSQRVETLKTSNGSVDLSKAKSSVVIIEHEGSPTSLEPVTIEFNNVSTAKVIFFVPRGADYPVTLALPYIPNIRREVSIKEGNSALLTWCSYGTSYAWRWYEIQKGPIYTPSAHDFTVHNSEGDHVTVRSDASWVEITSSDLIKVKNGIVDFTVQFVLDYENPNFGVTFSLQIYDESGKKSVIEKELYKDSNYANTGIVLMTCRFAFVSEGSKKYSIRAKLHTLKSSIDISNVNVTGTWINQ